MDHDEIMSILARNFAIVSPENTFSDSSKSCANWNHFRVHSTLENSDTDLACVRTGWSAVCVLKVYTGDVRFEKVENEKKNIENLSGRKTCLQGHTGNDLERKNKVGTEGLEKINLNATFWKYLLWLFSFCEVKLL